MKAYLSGGENAVGKINWKVGRPMKYHYLDEGEINNAISKTSLTQQIGMSLEAKATLISHETEKDINGH